MNRTPVSSSNVASVGYDEETQTLEVEFRNGSVYQYAGFSEGAYKAFMSASSKGRYLHKRIKGKYAYRKVG